MNKIKQYDPTIVQQGRNASYRISSAIKRATEAFKPNHKRVRFAKTHATRTFFTNDTPTLVTYDSGADGHYISEHDRIAAGLPILKRSHKRVSVANGESSTAKHVTSYHFTIYPQKPTKLTLLKTSPHHS